MQLGQDGLSVQLPPALFAPPLRVARTVYVNSATGNDANPGTLAEPFATFARALQDRFLYGRLFATYTIRMVGVGPYTLGHILSSDCGDGGSFVVLGDSAAETIHASGTFTGNFNAALTIGTSAGLGVNTQLGRFVRVTSGAAVGCTFQVVANTDTSIQTANNSFGIAIANGDTFQIFSPGTTFENPIFTPKIENCTGGDAPAGVSAGTLNLKHIFVDCAFTRAPGIRNSQVALVNCKMNSALGVGQGAQINTYIPDATVIGLGQGALRSGAVWLTASGMGIGGAAANAYGIFYAEGTIGVSGTGLFQPEGGRFAALNVTPGGCALISSQPTAGYHFAGEINVRGGVLDATQVVSTPFAVFAVAAGDCLQARDGGLIRWAIPCTGGTTDAAGFGATTFRGGRIYFSGAPTATGGTATRDLQTTANPVGVANATLGAAGASVDALGSPFAEALVRV